MRHHCCAVDPSDPTCLAEVVAANPGSDCSQSSYGTCVPKPNCAIMGYDDRYFFNEFMGRCELKEHCLPFYEWDEKSRNCETRNPCDQAEDSKMQQYEHCVTECGDGFEFDEAMQRC